jgi:hypothetical protein
MRSMGALTAMRISSLPVIMMGGEVRGKNKKRTGGSISMFGRLYVEADRLKRRRAGGRS